MSSLWKTRERERKKEGNKKKKEKLRKKSIDARQKKMDSEKWWRSRTVENNKSRVYVSFFELELSLAYARFRKKLENPRFCKHGSNHWTGWWIWSRASRGYSIPLLFRSQFYYYNRVSSGREGEEKGRRWIERNGIQGVANCILHREIEIRGIFNQANKIHGEKGNNLALLWTNFH